MRKIILNSIIALSIKLIVSVSILPVIPVSNLFAITVSVVFMSVSPAGATDYKNEVEADDAYNSSTLQDISGGTIELKQIHAGTAWDAYNNGNLAEADRQFSFLIDKAAKDSSSNMTTPSSMNTDSNTTTSSEELMNLKLGLAYTRMKLASTAISQKEDLYFSQKMLVSSKELFADLIDNGYKLTDSVPAILEILSQLKDYETMDNYLPMLANLFSEDEMHDKWGYLFAQSAWASYHAKEYLEAEKKFNTLLKRAPDDASLVTGLGYTLYQQGRYDAAYDLIHDFMQKQKRIIKTESENISDPLALKNSEISKILELKQMICSKLADPATPPEMKGRYSSFQGFESKIYHRHKNGDDGTSRLDETSVLVNAKKPFDLYNNTDWGIWIKSRVLSNDNAELSSSTAGVSSNKAEMSAENSVSGRVTPDKPSVITGSFYKSLNGQKARSSSDNNDVAVHEAALEWKAKNLPIPFSPEIEISLGISPSGGAAQVTPVFAATAAKQGWRAGIHRRSVDDSILSIAGFDDPYSNNEWGRVIKNGVTIGKDLSFGKNRWLSLNGGFDAYRGVNMWQNSSLQLNAAAGRTFARPDGDELTLGIYATWMHFEHNSNFYTFG
ncbi:MAG: BCSC C-terminal domain-containing protein, partial [Desulfamplus sp.]|nr:BCSC C-terminal domain-containing protein [Desulfamplus sp.]